MRCAAENRTRDLLSLCALNASAGQLAITRFVTKTDRVLGKMSTRRKFSLKKINYCTAAPLQVLAGAPPEKHREGDGAVGCVPGHAGTRGEGDGGVAAASRLLLFLRWFAGAGSAAMRFRRAPPVDLG